MAHASGERDESHRSGGRNHAHEGATCPARRKAALILAGSGSFPAEREAEKHSRNVYTGNCGEELNIRIRGADAVSDRQARVSGEVVELHFCCRIEEGPRWR